ncbi:MAG: NAD(P)H-hydrate dehydratase [Bacteroidota bacterium]
MRVLTGREMAALDRRAQAEFGLPGLILMENAGRAVADFVEKRYGHGVKVGIICGPGNNGGDGLVAGRHLALAGCRVEMWLGADEADYEGDALTNLKIVKALGLVPRPLSLLEPGVLRETLSGLDVLIDAFFGTGFRGAPRPEAAWVLRAVNESRRPVVAVDIPSGVDADTGAVPGEAIRAEATVTFALPKLGCFLYPGAGHCGELVVAPISLPVDDVSACERFLTEAGDVCSMLPRRPREAHKGLNGHVIVVGGSAGLTGAPFLAARGALRAGAGLATVLLPESAQAWDKPAEIMIRSLPAGPGGGFGPAAARSLPACLARADVLAVGPGMGQDPGTWAFLAAVLETWTGPLILDADGLNLLAAHADTVPARRGPLIMTPHPGEMARLAGMTIAGVQENRIDCALRAASRWQATVVLKGVPTVIASPAGKVWLNPTGDPAMAAGGMGDVLTGAIAALIGQGMDPMDAAVAGVYLHGLAGELAASATGGPGILAGEVADLLPAAVRKVKSECRAIPN